MSKKPISMKRIQSFQRNRPDEDSSSVGRGET